MAELTLHLQAASVSVCARGPSPANSITAPDGQSAEAGSHLLELETTYAIRRPELIRLLVKHGLDFIEAEDVTQEVFLRALERPANDNPPENLFRWVLACAKNLAIDRYRRYRKEVLAPAEAWEKWEKELPDFKANTEASVLEEDRYRRLVEAVSKLTEQEQQCLTLRSQGVSFREIASILEVTPRQAAYLTDVAVDKLRRKLQAFKHCGE